MLRIVLAAALALLLAPVARADVLRAGDGEEYATAAEAFAAAADNPGPDTVILLGLDEAGAFGDAPGEPVELVGVASVLRGPLTLAEEGSSVATLTVEGDVELAGTAEDVLVGGDLDLGCEPARHLEVTGDAVSACADAAGVSDSLLRGTVELPTRYSAYTPAGGHVAGPGDVAGTDAALLRDAGDPEPLAPEEGITDIDGLPRMADGDGDGVARRDIGPREHHPTPVPLAAGNLLRNPGAEEGLAHWTAAGVIAVDYGTDPYPGVAAGEALGAGARMFAGGPVLSGTLTQAVDLRNLAPEIDAGGATATLAALVGGYRAEADAGSVALHYTGPDGSPVGGATELPPVSAFERGHAVTLLRRETSAAIPPLARTAIVTLTAQRSTGTFADAYFDDVALTVAVPPPDPGQPPPPPPPPPDDPTLKPFSGVAVLTARVKPGRGGRIRLRLGCADATIGRCGGVLTLVAVLRSDTQARRIGSAGFSLAPGATRRVRIRLSAAALRRLRRGRLRATLYAAARDGQGLTATSTSPVKLERRRR